MDSHFKTLHLNFFFHFQQSKEGITISHHLSLFGTTYGMNVIQSDCWMFWCRLSLQLAYRFATSGFVPAQQCRPFTYSTFFLAFTFMPFLTRPTVQHVNLHGMAISTANAGRRPLPPIITEGHSVLQYC